jgi:hypothetical protein
MKSSNGFKFGRFVSTVTYQEMVRVYLLREQLQQTDIQESDELYEMHQAYVNYAKMTHRNLMRPFDLHNEVLRHLGCHFAFVDFAERGPHVLALVPFEDGCETQDERFDAVQAAAQDAIETYAQIRGRDVPEKYTFDNIRLSNGYVKDLETGVVVYGKYPNVQRSV